MHSIYAHQWVRTVKLTQPPEPGQRCLYTTCDSCRRELRAEGGRAACDECAADSDRAWRLVRDDDAFDGDGFVEYGRRGWTELEAAAAEGAEKHGTGRCTCEHKSYYHAHHLHCSNSWSS